MYVELCSLLFSYLLFVYDFNMKKTDIFYGIINKFWKVLNLP